MHHLPDTKGFADSEVAFDDHVAEEDFRMKLRKDKTYTELLELRRGAQKNKCYAQSGRILTQCNEYSKNERKNFKSSFNFRKLLSIQNSVNQFNQSYARSDLLKSYYRIDQKLLIYRDLIIETSVRLDMDIQLAIDISRGK